MFLHMLTHPCRVTSTSGHLTLLSLLPPSLPFFHTELPPCWVTPVVTRHCTLLVNRFHLQRACKRSVLMSRLSAWRGAVAKGNSLLCWVRAQQLLHPCWSGEEGNLHSLYLNCWGKCEEERFVTCPLSHPHWLPRSSGSIPVTNLDAKLSLTQLHTDSYHLLRQEIIPFLLLWKLKNCSRN